MKRVCLLAVLIGSPAIAQDAPPPPRVNQTVTPASTAGLSPEQLAQVEAIVDKAVSRAAAGTALGASSQVGFQLPSPANQVTVVVPPGPIRRAIAAAGQRMTNVAKPRTRTMLLASPGVGASPQR